MRFDIFEGFSLLEYLLPSLFKINSIFKMFLSNVVFTDNVKILIFFQLQKNPQSISTMTYHNEIHSKMLMNWTSALCLDFQKNVYSKKPRCP